MGDRMLCGRNMALIRILATIIEYKATLASSTFFNKVKLSDRDPYFYIRLYLRYGRHLDQHTVPHGVPDTLKPRECAYSSGVVNT